MTPTRSKPNPTPQKHSTSSLLFGVKIISALAFLTRTSKKLENKTVAEGMRAKNGADTQDKNQFAQPFITHLYKRGGGRRQGLEILLVFFGNVAALTRNITVHLLMTTSSERFFQHQVKSFGGTSKSRCRTHVCDT